MKYLRVIALSPLALALFSGCGGGGGTDNSSRSVKLTVSMNWPTTTKSVTRAVARQSQFAVVEAFDGATRVNFVTLQKSANSFTSSQDIQVPVPNNSTLTFYVNAYDTNVPVNPATGDYVTDPASGQVLHNNAPLTSSEPHPPLGHAVSTVNIAQQQTITFTMNNTVAKLEATSDALTTFRLGTSANSLFNTVTAKDATGATVLVDPTELIWDYADNLAKVRTLIAPATAPSPANPAGDPRYTLTPLATGTVNLKVTDTQVTGNQAPIQTIIKYTISPPANPITLQLFHDPDPAHVLTLDPHDLAQRIPLYAGSVKLTLVEQPLADPNDVAAAVQPIVQAVTFNPSSHTVTFPQVGFNYFYSGRPFLLTIDTYSGKDGTGVLIAETTSKKFFATAFLPAPVTTSESALVAAGTTYTYHAEKDTARTSNEFFLAADYKITKFILTPALSSIYFFNPPQTVPGLPSSVALQAALTGPNVPQPVLIDPTTLIWAAAPPAAVTVSNESAAPFTVGPAGTVAAKQVTQSTNVTMTATDRRPSGLTGVNTVAVKNGDITLGIK